MDKYSDLVGGIGIEQFDDGKPSDWKSYDPPEIDDELLEKTPRDVLAVLGFDPREFMTDAEKLYERRKKHARLYIKGGPGSGNFGHRGRRGQVGGSSTDGSSESSSAKKEPSEADSNLKSSMETMAGFFGQHEGIKDFKYKGSYDFVLKEGEFFDLPYAKLPKGIKKGRDKECFRNAFFLAVDNPDRYTYCEGFATAGFMPGFPFAHAWVIDNKTRKVVDNTWSSPGTSYYGVAFDTGFLIRTAMKNKVFGLLPDMITSSYNPFKDGFPDEAYAKKSIAKGGPGSGNFGHRGRPGQIGGSGTGTERKNSEVRKADAEEFAKALKNGVDKDKKAYVTSYEASEYRSMGANTFLSKDGKSGFALKPDGDIISVFSSVHKTGRGRYLMKMAIENGGSKLDCFEPLNTRVYSKFGFKETSRMKWDDKYAPDDWNYDRDGRPDVVFMEHKGKGQKKGGPGSGNFGHAGRPGQIGGSGHGGSQYHGAHRTTDISRYPDDAKKITPEMRMSQANYEDIKANMHKNLSKIAIGSPSLNEIKGTVGEARKDIVGNMLKQHEFYSAYLAGDTSNRVRDYIDHCRELMALDDLAGLDGKKVNDMFINAVDNIYYQEMESNRQQFTDHGIRHIVGNIIRQDQIMMASTDGKATGMDRLMGQFVMIHHDVGYTTPLIRQGGLRGVMVSSDHTKFSEKILMEQSSVLDENKGLFNESQFKTMLDIVRTHDSTAIERHNLLATSVRLSDNLSLFNREKLPGMFRYIENGQSLLSDMGLAAHAGDEVKFGLLKRNLHKQIDKADIGSQLKRDLKAATKEITYLTPKFSMGTLAGEISNISRASERVRVTIKHNEWDSFLQKHFDMGQKQTKKFLNDYGVTDFSKRSYSLADFLDLVVE